MNVGNFPYRLIAQMRASFKWTCVQKTIWIASNFKNEIFSHCLISDSETPGWELHMDILYLVQVKHKYEPVFQ